MSTDPIPYPSVLDPNDLVQSPIERAETIPSAWYTNPGMLEFEKKAIFSRYWQLVCHESRIPEPGDMLSFTIAGLPLVVVRDSNGKVRAFHNVCKHRGGPVAVKQGTTTVLQCKYHGWIYRMDGTLRGVPQFNKVDLFDKKDFGLEPVTLKTIQGFIFINLTSKSKDIDNLWNEISNRLSPISLSSFLYHSERTYEIDCNWKVYVDNFLEGYHIPIVHPELAKMLDYGSYQTETHPWYSLQYSPIQAGNKAYKNEGDSAYYFFVFPNIMLNILPGRLQTNIVRPVGTDRTEVIFRYYYLDPESSMADGTIEEDISYSHTIQLEDIEICELVQKGLGSPAYDKGRFSVEREQGVYHFQSLLKKVYREEGQTTDSP